ncbi:MAG: nuclear transport factor 2 family protein [Deltaproteobacteria bacterium]|nr:nuclear transport factor 2 family protein [Deltaproteobacteria bacterium]MBW2348910.1 nuclear transport factor 2 family protein [Deltaproteobacteria bacterium]
MRAEETVRQFFDRVNARDLSGLGALLEKDAIFFFPKTQPLSGRDRILRFFRVLFRQYPSLVFDVKRTIIQGPWAAVHWTNKGESRHGDPYENEGMTLLHLEGTRVRFISDFFKDTEKF